MKIPANIATFWSEFAVVTPEDISGRFHEAFHFDDHEASANGLCRLVLAGRKRATAALLWAHEVDNRRLPEPGDLSVVTNWAGDPQCVIETRAVDVVPFEEVSAEFAAVEGEGDGSLRYWRDVHWDYFGRECERIGRLPDRRMPVVCERFEVIYP
ncbi:MAG: ASCH domain-containing protein [Pseudomonadales bacterium]